MNEDNKNTESKSILREFGACPVCGGIVEQKNIQRNGKCQICGKEHKSYHYCENGHDFCDICYGSFAFSNLTSIVNTESKNPVEILNMMMSDESFGLRGCIHCVATPLSLVLAYRNIEGIGRKSHDLLIELFKIEVERTPISLCKETGQCGIPVACGNALSNLLPVLNSMYENSTVGKRLKTVCLDAVKDIESKNICCKKIAYTEVLTIADFTDRYLRVNFQMPEVIKCEYSQWNQNCEKENCAFYRGYSINQPNDLK
ncbi:MAG: DUF5714 domain-containing protein [Methanocorpusculum sp.]|nr:DUF5714 domain-containing protein [Methanocorpusculum sp.]